MKHIVCLLISYILIAGCGKKHQENNENNAVTFQGQYKAGTTLTVNRPIMYVSGNVTSEESVIKGFLVRRGSINDFIFGATTQILNTPITFTFSNSFKLNYHAGDDPAFPIPFTFNGGTGATAGKIYVIREPTSTEKASLIIMTQNDSIPGILLLPSNRCKDLSTMLEKVSQRITCPNGTSSKDCYGRTTFHLQYRNDSLVLPLISIAATSAASSCYRSVKDEWNDFTTQLANTFYLDPGDTVVVQTKTVALSKL